VRRRISSERWEQIKTAYASGIGLREVARNMGIPEGTVLARAKRERWTQQIQTAKALVKREDTPLGRPNVDA
jgi:DNA invertase Pin-like site-specific DNA recombinase